MADPNPYAPPSASEPAPPPGGTADPGELDRLMADLQLGGLTKAAIGLLAAVGAMLIGSALQLWGLTQLEGLVRFVPYLMVVLAGPFFTCSVKVYRGRVWAAVLGLVLSALTALAMGVWFLLSAASGFFSLLAVLVPMAAVAAAVFAGLAIGPCRRHSAARRGLAASGLPMDF
jgi:hypothetical protein